MSSKSFYFRKTKLQTEFPPKQTLPEKCQHRLSGSVNSFYSVHAQKTDKYMYNYQHKQLLLHQALLFGPSSSHRNPRDCFITSKNYLQILFPLAHVSSFAQTSLSTRSNPHHHCRPILTLCCLSGILLLLIHNSFQIILLLKKQQRSQGP